MKTTLTATNHEDLEDLEGIFSLALSRIAQEPSKAEQYIVYAQRLAESVGAVKTVAEKRRA